MSISTSHLCDWDPLELLEIINPDKRSFTCVGHAKSKGRRCWNIIAKHNIHSAKGLLAGLPQVCTDGPELKRRLHQAASLSLCSRFHQDQVESVATKWYAIIRNEVIRLGGTSHDPSSAQRSRERVTAWPRQRLRDQTDFLTSEPHEAVDNARTGTPEVAEEQPKECNRKPLSDDCPICFAKLDDGTDVIWCRAACGNNMHKECFDQWAAVATKKCAHVTCPFCRAPWDFINWKKTRARRILLRTQLEGMPQNDGESLRS